MPGLPQTDLQTKVAFLRRPEAFPDEPDSVEAIETHFAWVFLAGRHVYKLKKPVRFHELDLRTLEARRANCELEIALNRRLAAETYLAVVALGSDGPRLRLESDGQAVDWLVKMRRLPSEAALTHLLPTMQTKDPRLVRLLDTLCRFYGRAPRAPWSGPDYTRILAQRLGRYARWLAEAPALDRTLIEDLVARHADFIAANRALLERRVHEARIVDAHGDLRPEHIFLLDRPQVIDCLEFAATLRQLDAAEEISFLALECERLGHFAISERVRALYVERCRDDVPDRLFDYYRSRRALVRAFLAAWHLREPLGEHQRRHWLEQAQWYLAAARAGIVRASQTPVTGPT